MKKIISQSRQMGKNTKFAAGLTLGDIERFWNQAQGEKPTYYILSNTILEILKKKHPRKYKKWLALQKINRKEYKCSFQRMGEDL